MVGKALPLLLGFAWKKMHTDKAETYSSHSFLEKQYTSRDLSVFDFSIEGVVCLVSLTVTESGVERSTTLPLSLVKLPNDFSGKVVE
nr:hypothetical protein [Tanacetum cinerariifolium]